MRCGADEPIRAHEECAEDDNIIIAMSHFRLNRKINFTPRVNTSSWDSVH